MTQKAVGEAINVPQRTYAYYESGQRMIPPRVLCALADLYGVSVDYLLERTDKTGELGGNGGYFYLCRRMDFALPSARYFCLQRQLPVTVPKIFALPYGGRLKF